MTEIGEREHGVEGLRQLVGQRAGQAGANVATTAGDAVAEIHETEFFAGVENPILGQAAQMQHDEVGGEFEVKEEVEPKARKAKAAKVAKATRKTTRQPKAAAPSLDKADLLATLIRQIQQIIELLQAA